MSIFGSPKELLSEPMRPDIFPKAGLLLVIVSLRLVQKLLVRVWKSGIFLLLLPKLVASFASAETWKLRIRMLLWNIWSGRHRCRKLVIKSNKEAAAAVFPKLQSWVTPSLLSRRNAMSALLSLSLPLCHFTSYFRCCRIPLSQNIIWLLHSQLSAFKATCPTLIPLYSKIQGRNSIALPKNLANNLAEFWDMSKLLAPLLKIHLRWKLSGAIKLPINNLAEILHLRKCCWESFRKSISEAISAAQSNWPLGLLTCNDTLSV